MKQQLIKNSELENIIIQARQWNNRIVTLDTSSSQAKRFSWLKQIILRLSRLFMAPQSEVNERLLLALASVNEEIARLKSSQVELIETIDNLKEQIASKNRSYLPVGLPYVTSFNRILDNAARTRYQPVIDYLFTLVPDMMLRKIPEANVQQAFVLDTVQKFASQFVSPKIICIGSFEDTAVAGLKKLGYQIEEIDPAFNNLDLDTFFHLPSTVKESYNVVFSTSVMEHVQDDELFITQITELLAPGGVAVLTCDYNDQHKPEDPVIQGNYRFYTQKDLIFRILPLLKDCSLVDAPHWECSNPDFIHYKNSAFGDYCYTFATLVFQKHR